MKIIINDNLRRIGEETIMVHFNVLSQHSHGTIEEKLSLDVVISGLNLS
jgi:hypothetical protein